MASPTIPNLALEQGLRIFPVSRAGKVPIIKAWPERATNDRRLAEHWAEVFPGCNWAALTGERSNDLVIDIDGAQGRASLAELERKLGPLPKTLSALTGRADGGQQLHWLWPAGRDLHNSTGKISSGIDIRAKHGVAVIPDSVHPKTGKQYLWEDPRNRVALPESWVELIEHDWQQRHAPRKPGQDNHIEPDTQTGHDASPRHYPFRALLPNHRTNGLLRTAGKLERKGVPFERMKELLLAENLQRCHPPKPESKVIALAADITDRYAPCDVPDPLQAAWNSLQLSDAATTAFKFRSLVIELQRSRPDSPILLPQERIAALFGIGQQAISRICRNHVASGFLLRVGDYVPLEKAQHYIVNCQPHTPIELLRREETRTYRASPGEEEGQEQHSTTLSL
jgi:hypothetical protein